VYCEVVGAGILGTLTPLIVADLMRGTGRYNLALGAVATVQGIGASLSGLAAGVRVDHFGYGTTFLAAGLAAAIALGVCLLFMPETAPPRMKTPHLQSLGVYRVNIALAQLGARRRGDDIEKLQKLPTMRSGGQ
jgi:MFS family permease